MAEQRNVVANDQINEQFTWSEGQPTVEVKGLPRHGLKAAIRGGRATLSGKFSRPGTYEVTIVQKRTVKITFTVSQSKSVLDTTIGDLLTGKREPLDPPANPVNSPGWLGLRW
jgi:hypothetical protein